MSAIRTIRSPMTPHLRLSVFRGVVIMGMTMAALSAKGQDASMTKANLQSIAKQRVFFGHQSVGDNLLDGLRTLANDAHVPLNISVQPTAQSLPGGTFGHTYVADNTLPLKKLASFDQAMGQQASNVNIALVKFCYVDIHADTDVKQLFAAYQQTIQKLKTRHPGTTFLHVTTPLTAVQSGWKATLKSWLGKAPYGTLENAKRASYNQLMRQAYQNREPLFDLAHVESMLPDGSTYQVRWKGQSIPALVPAYSDDGEHLNAVGQRHAARHLLAVMATATR